MSTTPGAPSPATLQLNDAGQPEEISRADLYGLLARLWMGPPDAQLLAQLRAAPAAAGDETGHLSQPWRELVAAMTATSEQDADDEYAALFLGVGKPELFLYGSYYMAGALHEKPLAALRAELRELGLERDAARGETEDHVSFVFEVMRYLIAGDDVAVCNLERQRRFFRAHVQPWVGRMCDAVEAHPGAKTWRPIAAFTRAFMEVETQGFDMLET